MKIRITGTTEPDRKIHAIKGIRAATGLSLKDAKYVADGVFAGEPTVVEVLDHASTNVLRAHSLTFELVELVVKDVVIDALKRMPIWITVGDVLAVLDAVS
jgi:hypothetical protein